MRPHAVGCPPPLYTKGVTTSRNVRHRRPIDKLSQPCKQNLKPCNNVIYSPGSLSLHDLHTLLQHPSLLLFQAVPRVQYLQAGPHSLSVRRPQLLQAGLLFHCSHISRLQHILCRPETDKPAVDKQYSNASLNDRDTF
jgi:hypothetical protein